MLRRNDFKRSRFALSPIHRKLVPGYIYIFLPRSRPATFFTSECHNFKHSYSVEQRHSRRGCPRQLLHSLLLRSLVHSKFVSLSACRTHLHTSRSTVQHPSLWYNVTRRAITSSSLTSSANFHFSNNNRQSRKGLNKRDILRSRKVNPPITHRSSLYLVFESPTLCKTVLITAAASLSTS
jgi:hypothetical protein